jgi:nucleotidyltransferase-like protein
MKTASAIILAGGNGERLRPLTRRLVGDDRPKQYCPVVGEETLLDQTRRRAAALVTPDRTLIVVTREHEPYYAPALAELPARNVVEQPVGRGTAPAILYALLRLRTVAPGGTVAILPSDHYVDDDAAFMARVEGADGGRDGSPGHDRPARSRAGSAGKPVRMDRARRCRAGPLVVAGLRRPPVLGEAFRGDGATAHAGGRPLE